MRNDEVISLINPYKDKLYRFALSILHNVYDAEDVMQELLVRIWKKRDEFVELENKQAWCMTVTRNLAIDKIRKNKKTQNNLDISECYNVSDSNATPAELVVRNDEMKKLVKMIDELSENQKTVIHLRDIEGYSYKEISELAGLTLDQVKINLHRGRQALKDKILNNLRKTK
ncbi:MAG TPA: RNA polymerase sigma factor [Saprospiraceae bacterium]|nr:RNA polymerase sigma factor [Saprospiraceae bacterium]MCB9329256.1 RNA polymerase sigma factor [Lewinellaceae bacterium]HPK09370.1 RNA polymerase sigma factor [Saprospiraceae bacterium]HRX28678.1 RNA polymerase sigma factor [Saprospiraceae bacterium]